MKSEGSGIFASRLAEVTAEVLSQISGRPYKGGLADAEHEYPGEDLTNVELVIRNVENGKLVLQFGEDFLHATASALLGTPIPSVDRDSEEQRAIEKFWHKVIGCANTQLTDLLNQNELEVIGLTELLWEPATVAGIEIGSVDGRMGCRVLFSQCAAESLLDNVEKAASVVTAQPSRNHDNLGILLDIPLAVTLRFGEKRMSLREILQLSSGAVIELDRQAEEPVDLCLEGRVIARGKVVVIDGCYGLRVTELCRRPEEMVRLRGAR